MEQTEPNYFDELRGILSEEELIRFRHRFKKAGKLRLAEVLTDEIQKRRSSKRVYHRINRPKPLLMAHWTSPGMDIVERIAGAVLPILFFLSRCVTWGKPRRRGRSGLISLVVRLGQNGSVLSSMTTDEKLDWIIDTLKRMEARQVELKTGVDEVQAHEPPTVGSFASVNTGKKD